MYLHRCSTDFNKYSSDLQISGIIVNICAERTKAANRRILILLNTRKDELIEKVRSI